MAARKDKLVIDTNLWISYLLTPEHSRIDKLLNDESAVLLFSNELLEEFTEVTQRPKFRRFFAAEDVAMLAKEIQQVAEFVEVGSEVNICRDIKDNFLLSLARDGNATHLLTGDKDLLVLGKFEGTIILTIRDYLSQK